MNHITLAITNIDQSFTFYRDIIGLKPLVKWHAGAYFLTNNNFWFCLNLDPSRKPTPCYTHYAFSVPEDEFDSMCQRIKSSGVPLFKDNTSPGQSLYFMDPDGHKLELHVGQWQDRIEAKKNNPGSWLDIEWFV